MGWSVEGALDPKKLSLRRPPRAVSRQGSARRVRDPHGNFTAAQLQFLEEHAAQPPKLLQGRQLSIKSKEVLGDEFYLEAEQIIRWATSRETKHRQAAEHALARKGMPSYDDWTPEQLERELTERNIPWGQKREKGKRKLLEQDDTRRQPPQKKSRVAGGSAVGGGSRGKRKKPKAKKKAKQKAKGKRKGKGKGKGTTKKPRSRR